MAGESGGSLQEQVKAALDAAAMTCDTRIYPNVGQDSPTAPYIVYSRVANNPENTLASGIPIENARVQIDSYDKTYAGAQLLANQVQAALAAAGFPCVLLLEQDLYEDSVKLHRVTQDYSIWG